MTKQSRPPELVVDGYQQKRPRWVEIATSPNHKDIGSILIVAALGFLAIAALELLLMRLQLLVPENSFLSPVGFNRMLSLYGATAIQLFALPFAIGLFYYVVPLQIGARGTALPRLGQVGLWLYLAAATVLYAGIFYTPSEAGVNPLSPFSEFTFIPNNGVNAWAASTGLALTGFVLIAIDLIATLRRMRAPGMAWRRMPIFSWAGATAAWLLLVIGPVMVAAVTMLLIDINVGGAFFSGDSGGAPLLWQHLSWIFYTGTYMLLTITAFGAIAEIFPAFARKPLFNREGTIVSMIAIAVLGTLAWTQNMFTAPIGIGWMHFGMVMALALIVPVGLILFNLIETLVGGAIKVRAPMLFAVGALSMMTIGLASEIAHSLIASGWRLQGTVDSTGATHFALVGSAVFGGFAALHWWFPKITGRTMGESLARLSFWTMVLGALLSFLPMFAAGTFEGQVIDAYKYFSADGVTTYNVLSSIGVLILSIGILLTLANALASREGGGRAGHDPWGGDSLEWFTLSPPEPHNFDVQPDVRSARPLRDIRDAVARRDSAAHEPRRESQPIA